MSSDASSSSPAPTFDVVVGGNGNFVPEIVAAKLLSTEPLMSVPSKTFSPGQLASFTQKRVLICGSYFDLADILRVREVAKSVTVWVYSFEDDVKYGVALCASSDDVPSEFNKAFSVFDIDTFKTFPRALRLLRRSLSPPGYANEGSDEAFYRGLMYEAHLLNLTSEDVINMWLEGGFEADSTDDDMISTGRVLTVEHRRLAEDMVHNGAVIIETDTHLQVQVVVGGCSLIRPVADAAASSANGVNVGVNVRYDLKSPGHTLLTFVAPRKMNLSFVDKEPWFGGGLGSCKGAKLKGLVPITEILDMLKKTVTAV